LQPVRLGVLTGPFTVATVNKPNSESVQPNRALDERARAATTPFHLAKNPSMSSPTSSCCPRNGAGIPSSEF